MRGTVSPKLIPFLEQANIAIAAAKDQNIQLTPELVRGNLEKLAPLIGQGPDIALVEDREFVLADRVIPVRVYHPNPAKHLPVIMHYHGGGHMCGNVNLYDPISRRLADTTQCIVVCVEYRLSPEHPYPAGIDDCEYSLIHYADVLHGLKFNDQIYIAGDSGGGAICTTLTMNSLTNSAIKIDKQILIYPSVDYTMSCSSIEENGTGYLLEKEKIVWYFEQYFQSNAQDKQLIQEASPLLGEFSTLMPETLVITAGCDPLRDEGMAYVDKLRSVTVITQHFSFPGMIHAYMLLDGLVHEECEQTYQYIADFVKN